MSRADRVALLERPAREFPLVTQAALLGLNRSHLYYVPVPPAGEERALKRRIDELFTAHPFYGVRKITAQLRKDGCLVNHKAVARHMREMGLAAIYPGPNLSKRAHAHAVYPYRLRAVTAQRPNHVWGIDITYIRLRHGWMYLVAVLDWYSRYVVSWALDQTLQQGFVLEAVDAALAVATPTIWNSFAYAWGAPPRMKICILFPSAVPLLRSLVSSAAEPANSSTRVLQGTTVCRFHSGKHVEETLHR